MRVVLQRVASASVCVGDEEVSRIGAGLLLLVCVEDDDTEAETARFARKIAAMRIFTDDDGRMNRDVRNVGGAVLAVSNFTLAGRWQKGNRPDFSAAAKPERARELYERFCRDLESEGLAVSKGRFGASMVVESVNDGPVTLWMSSRER